MPDAALRNRALMLALAATVLGACGDQRAAFDAGTDAADAQPDAATSCAWQCPSGWLPHAAGGCGPAVALCREGLAAPGACAHVDLTNGPGASDAGSPFYLRSDGSFAGRWPEPDSVGIPDAPPDRDWAPDAGIPSCAPGWQRATDGTCDALVATTCDTSAGPLPGGSCTASGQDRCPADLTGFPDPGAAAGNATRIYVRSGADANTADGSMQRPFPSISAGVQAAGTDGWVLVAGGIYLEAIDIHASVHVLGLCAAQTRIDAGGNASAIAVGAAGTVVDLGGVTVTGGGAGVVASSGARVDLHEVVVTGAIGAGISADGVNTALTATDVLVRGTQAGSSAVQGGLVATGGATMALARVSLVANVGRGVHADGVGTSVTIEDAVVDGSATQMADLIGGVGLYAVAGAVVTAQRVVITGSEETGALAGGTGSVLGLADVIVRDTAVSAPARTGFGIRAIDHGAVTVTRALIDNNLRIGTRAENASVEITQSVVRRTRAPAMVAGWGDALKSSLGGSLTASGVIMTTNQGGGAVVDAQSTLDLTDCSVVDTSPGNMHVDGVGLWVGGTLTAQRVRIDRSTSSGILVVNGASLTLRDSVVRDTRVDANMYGAEISSVGAADLDVARSTMVGGFIAVVSVADRATLRLADSILEGGPMGGPHGLHGLDCQFARATVDRVLVSHTRAVGIGAFMGCQLVATDVAVRDVVDVDPLSGFGLAAAGGTLTARNVVVQGATTMATLAYAGGTLSLRDVIVDQVRNGAAGVAAGAIAAGDSQVDALRVGILGAGGTAIGTTPYTGGPALEPDGQLIARDLFVYDVRPSTIEATPPPEAMPTGPSVSFAILAGTGGFVYAARAVLDTAAYGFLDSLGELQLDDVVLANHGHLGAVRSGGTGIAPSIRRVCTPAGGASDIVVDDSLPEVHFSTAP